MKSNKLFAYFMVGSFAVASLLIFLYRAIETDAHIYAFLFLSSLIISFFCAFLLELMFLDPIIDEIIDLSEDSRLLYNLLILSLFFTVLVIIPKTIIRETNAVLANEQKTNPSNCSLILINLQKSPKSIYDTKPLARCEYTRLLSRIIPTNNSAGENDSQKILFVIGEYMGLFSRSISFTTIIFLVILGGISYSAFVTLFLKKVILLIAAIAIKMLSSSDGWKE